MSQSENYMVIQKVLSGDVDAYGFLVSKYQKSIYNLMYRQTRLKEEAADLTQETFLKAYERLERFRPEKETVLFIGQKEDITLTKGARI